MFILPLEAAISFIKGRYGFEIRLFLNILIAFDVKMLSILTFKSTSPLVSPIPVNKKFAPSRLPFTFLKIKLRLSKISSHSPLFKRASSPSIFALAFLALN